MFIQLSQAGALLGLGTGVAAGPAAAILIGPAVIAKLFTRVLENQDEHNQES